MSAPVRPTAPRKPKQITSPSSLTIKGTHYATLNNNGDVSYDDVIAFFVKNYLLNYLEIDIVVTREHVAELRASGVQFQTDFWGNNPSKVVDSVFKSEFKSSRQSYQQRLADYKIAVAQYRIDLANYERDLANHKAKQKANKTAKLQSAAIDILKSL